MTGSNKKTCHWNTHTRTRTHTHWGRKTNPKLPACISVMKIENPLKTEPLALISPTAIVTKAWLPDIMPLVGRKCFIIYTHFCSFVLRDLRQKWAMIVSVKIKMWKQKQHTWSKPVIMHNILFWYHDNIKPKHKNKKDTWSKLVMIHNSFF